MSLKCTFQFEDAALGEANKALQRRSETSSTLGGSSDELLWSMEDDGESFSRRSPSAACNANAPDATCLTKKAQRSVSFDKVRVRVFERILADNPPTSSGPSLGLGWNYNDDKEMDLDKFESKTPSTIRRFMLYKRNSGSKKMSPLTPDQRKKMAKKLGFSKQEIQENVEEVEKILRLRSITEETVALENSFQEMAKYHGLSAK